MTDLSIKQVRKSFGAVEVIKGVDLEINRGELVVIVGPSGCGKSTMLRMIAGLEEITAGEMYIGGKLVNDLTPASRGIAMVFQSYALYPHMNVFDNMAFGLKLAKMEKAKIDVKIHEVAKILRLEEYLDRLPKHLSGGQRQRVAIGRAIVRDPDVFLFDEPLSNLDAALRVATRIEISKLHDSMPEATMIFVTHDQVEAMTLADRIVVLRAGVVEQIGTPKEVYQTPANLFVAQFIGSPAMNVVDCKLESASPSSSVTLMNGGTFDVLANIGPDQVGKTGKLGVRPEHLKLGEQEGAIFSGRIELVEFLGDVTIVHLDIGLSEHILAKIDGNIDVAKDQTIHLTADASEIHVFDDKGGAIPRA